MESLRQAERKNWTLDQHHIANLCDSLNHFLTQTGQLPHLGGPQQPPRISESCAMNSGKQEQPMSQGILSGAFWEGICHASTMADLEPMRTATSIPVAHLLRMG